MEYNRGDVTHQYIANYIQKVLAPSQGLLAELEEYAQKEFVPIIHKETAAFLRVWLSVQKPLNILEVGTAIGYSAILFAQSTDAHIITLEKEAAVAEIARENIKKAYLDDRISVVNAEAGEYLAACKDEDKFDVIFLDGPKSHYVHYLHDCVRLCKNGGVLIADNILYKGRVADGGEVKHGSLTIVRHLREFLEVICRHKNFDSCIIPIGDGISISRIIK